MPVQSLKSVPNICSVVTVGEILEVVVPEDVPVDIRVKLMVCLIHQDVFTPLNVSSLHRFRRKILRCDTVGWGNTFAGRG